MCIVGSLASLASLSDSSAAVTSTPATCLSAGQAADIMLAETASDLNSAEAASEQLLATVSSFTTAVGRTPEPLLAASIQSLKMAAIPGNNNNNN